jgi:hypothetical protein
METEVLATYCILVKKVPKLSAGGETFKYQFLITISLSFAVANSREMFKSLLNIKSMHELAA